MRALAVAALVAAALAALSLLVATPRPLRPSVLGAPSAGSSAQQTAASPSRCPAGTLEDDGVCVPVPRRATAERPERIAKRPERDPDYLAYALPVERSVAAVAEDPLDGGPLEGLSLRTPPGSPVRLVALEGQRGDAVLVYAGPEAEGSVVTRHAVAGPREQSYLVAVERLVPAALGAAGATLRPGTPLGRTAGGPLRIRTRLARPGVDAATLTFRDASDDATTLSVDPRNVLRKAP